MFSFQTETSLKKEKIAFTKLSLVWPKARSVYTQRELNSLRREEERDKERRREGGQEKGRKEDKRGFWSFQLDF